MAPSVLLIEGILFLMSCAQLARSLDVALTLYTGIECKTPSVATPDLSANLSTCIVTPGLVSLRYASVPCAGGGTVIPYLFADAACRELQVLLRHYRAGSDSHCLSDYASDSIAAVQLGCDQGRPETPVATTTVSVAPVATPSGGASPAADRPPDSDMDLLEKGWKALGLGARIGIIAAAAVVGLALCLGLCLYLCRCIRPSPSPSHPSRPTPSAAYMQVLDNVVRTANQHAASGHLDNSSERVDGPPRDAVPASVLSVAFAKHNPEWRHKLGVAGELYYLKGLWLPNFGLQNWTSSLRTLVRAYPGYQGLGPERDGIADIEYFDETGSFTEFLLSRGYSAQGIQRGMTPTYCFEVKSTTDTNRQAPFFMSPNQEAHSRDALITTSQPERVYIICRIFGLGRGSATRLSIYLDPEAQRREGRLHFTLDEDGVERSWRVRPG